MFSGQEVELDRGWEGPGGLQGSRPWQLGADTHQRRHTWDLHGQGLALFQCPGCGLERVSRESVGQGPNPAHEARLGLGRFLGILESWGRG